MAINNNPTKYFILVFLLTGIEHLFGQSALKIEDHFKALSAHDVKAIAADYSDSAKVYSPNWEDAKTGPAGIVEVYTRYFKSTPDLSYKIKRVINAANNVMLNIHPAEHYPTQKVKHRSI